MGRKIYAGIDVGGTKIAAALVDRKGKILSRRKAPTPRKAGPKAIVRAVEKLVEELCDDRGISRKRLAGVGVGAPGIIAPDGRVVMAPNIGLTGCRLLRELSKRLRVPVAVGNDANLGVLGEQWLGAGRGAPDAVGLFVGTGVGGGVIAGGRLLTGAHGAAAELGHIVMDPAGPLCGCGNRGCLEAYASRTAIEKRLRQAVRAGRRSVVTELAKPGLAVIKSKVLAKSLKKKDKLVVEVMREASRRLGAACAMLRRAFDPKVFIIGGGVAEACGDFMLPIVRREIQKDPFFRGVPACRVVPSELGDDAVILGAVAMLLA